jgi:hypothetical protein
VAAYRAFSERIGDPLEPEAELRNKFIVDAAGRISGPRTPAPAVREGYTATMIGTAKDYHPAPIHVPALAIYAVPGTVEDAMRGYDAGDPAIRQKVSELFVLARERYEHQTQWFKTFAGSGARVTGLAGAHHLFLSNPAEVRQEIEKFANALR